MAKSPVQRLIPWVVVGLLALTTVLAVQSDPASAQSATATATTGSSASPAPTTAPPPTTSTPTPTQQYGTTDVCAPEGYTGPGYLTIAFTSPTTNSTVSGTVTLTGTITRSNGAPAGTVSNVLYVVSGVTTTTHQWQGENTFSVPWRSDGGAYPDATYGVYVTSRIGDQPVDKSPKLCLHTLNSMPGGIRAIGHVIDPRYVSRGEIMTFYIDLWGETNFRPQTALVPLYIHSTTGGTAGPDRQLVTLQVTPVSWAIGTGGYAFEIHATYAYRTFESPGPWGAKAGLTLNPGQEAWTWPSFVVSGFEVLGSDTGTATTAAPTTTSSYAVGPTVTYGSSQTAQPTWMTTGPPTTTTPPTTTPYNAEPTGNAWIDPAAIGFSSVRPLPGERVTIYVRVQNPIETPVEGTITIFDAKPDGQQDIVLRQTMQLDAYEYQIVSAPWTPAAEGDHLVSAIFTDNSPEGKHIPDTAISKSRIYVGDGPTGTPILVMSAGLINIGTLQEGETRTVPVTVTAYNQWLPGVRVLALDPSGVKVRSLTPPTDLAPGQSATYYLQVEVPPLGENQTLGSQRLIVMARAESVSSNVESLSLIVHQEGFAGLPYISGQVALVAVAGTGAATAFFRRRGGNPPV